MIYLLQGTIHQVEDDFAVLLAGGVGYQVFASSRTLTKLDAGQAAQLYIYTHVREDHIYLYGFDSHADRSLFETLLNVSGVGARMALALLSAMTADEITRAITLADTTALTRANGVGKKLAERIVLELKGKLGSLPVADGAAVSTPAAQGPAADVVSALTNMGFRPAQAQQAIAAVQKQTPDADFGAMLKAALKELHASQ